MTKMLRRTILLLLAVAAACCLAASARAEEGLTGAGSSFVYPLLQQWTTGYGGVAGVHVGYDPIGSGGGIAQISARAVDFGASDAPLTASQFALANGVVQIPWALSATSIPYNLPGVNDRLRLTGTVLAEIYLGSISQWNDPRIRALNPGSPLPTLKITPIYRSDASGTTFNFTGFLSSSSADWQRRIGAGTAVEFPAGLGAVRSSGVADAVLKTPGTIGYVDVAYSLQNHMRFAAIRNRAGAYTLPGLRSIGAAASTVTSISPTNELTIVDPPSSNRLAYPIATFSYVIVPLKTPRALALRKFIFWALTEGQKYGPRLLFAPIPKIVLVRAEQTLIRITA
jgi:phosphate transport system substrate-binding protein